MEREDNVDLAPLRWLRDVLGLRVICAAIASVLALLTDWSRTQIVLWAIVLVGVPILWHFAAAPPDEKRDANEDPASSVAGPPRGPAQEDQQKQREHARSDADQDDQEAG